MTAVADDLVASEIAFLTGRLLRHRHLLRTGLAVMLDVYRGQLSGPESRIFGLPSVRYVQVAAALEQRIAAGEWAPGMRVPQQGLLAAEFGASHKTVARAVHVLALKGMMRRAGNSYYVTEERPDDRT
jgi:hypothetical protein